MAHCHYDYCNNQCYCWLLVVLTVNSTLSLYICGLIAKWVNHPKYQNLPEKQVCFVVDRPYTQMFQMFVVLFQTLLTTTAHFYQASVHHHLTPLLTSTETIMIDQYWHHGPLSTSLLFILLLTLTNINTQLTISKYIFTPWLTINIVMFHDYQHYQHCHCYISLPPLLIYSLINHQLTTT